MENAIHTPARTQISKAHIWVRKPARARTHNYTHIYNCSKTQMAQRSSVERRSPLMAMTGSLGRYRFEITVPSFARWQTLQSGERSVVSNG